MYETYIVSRQQLVFGDIVTAESMALGPQETVGYRLHIIDSGKLAVSENLSSSEHGSIFAGEIWDTAPVDKETFSDNNSCERILSS